MYTAMIQDTTPQLLQAAIAIAVLIDFYFFLKKFIYNINLLK
jgi:hypothetical protein